MKKTTLILVFLLTVGFSFSQSVATYTITIEGTWNDTDHGSLPSNDHWSNLVGANHNSNVVFWAIGSLASPGVEDVAEVGVNTDFNNEVNSAISAGDAEQWLQAGWSPNEAMGTAVLNNITVSEEFPLLSLITMIAPSPDWFTGVNSFSFLDGDNNWKDNIVLDLFPYDAGTEDGTGYSINNAATNPHEVISSLINVAPFNDQRVATLTFTLENVLNIGDPSLEDSIRLSPNPASDVITIANRSSHNLNTVSVYNILGNLVEEVNVNSSSTTSLDVSNYAAGIYLFRIEDDQQRLITKKIVVN